MTFGHNIHLRLLTVICLSLLSCKSKAISEGRLNTTVLPVSSYLKAIAAYESTGEKTSVQFPQLQVYTPSGTLLYSSSDTMENVGLLQDIQERIKTMKQRPTATNLSQIVDQIPDFKTRKREIIDGDKVIILSVFLDGCKGCSIQEEALTNSRHQLLAAG